MAAHQGHIAFILLLIASNTILISARSRILYLNLNNDPGISIRDNGGLIGQESSPVEQSEKPSTDQQVTKSAGTGERPAEPPSTPEGQNSTESYLDNYPNDTNSTEPDPYLEEIPAGNETILGPPNAGVSRTEPPTDVKNNTAAEQAPNQEQSASPRGLSDTPQPPLNSTAEEREYENVNPNENVDSKQSEEAPPANATASSESNDVDIGTQKAPAAALPNSDEGSSKSEPLAPPPTTEDQQIKKAAVDSNRSNLAANEPSGNVITGPLTINQTDSGDDNLDIAEDNNEGSKPPEQHAENQPSPIPQTGNAVASQQAAQETTSNQENSMPTAPDAVPEQIQESPTVTPAPTSNASSNVASEQVSKSEDQEVPSSKVVDEIQKSDAGEISAKNTAEQMTNNTSPPSRGSVIVDDLTRTESLRESTAAAFSLDPDTCGQISLGEKALNMTVKRILKLMSDRECCDKLNLKLRPARNEITLPHQTMEVSSMSIPSSMLLKSDTMSVRCLSAQQGAGDTTRLRLEFEGNISDTQYTETNWRLYNRIQYEDVSMQLFESRSNQNNQISSGARSMSRGQIYPEAGATGWPTKCQRFMFGSGSVILIVHPFQAKMLFEVDLERPRARADANSLELDGMTVRMLQFKAKGVHISTVLHKHTVRRTNSLQFDIQYEGYGPNGGVKKLAESNSPIEAKSTVQAMHDNNQHHRRNYWQLDMYNNWLKHEYRRQLRALFNALERKFNNCLIT